MNRGSLTCGALLALAITLSVCACPGAAASMTREGMGASANDAPRVITDEVGRRVHIRGEVNRIVTLSPDLTETIYALGLQDKLVGDTDYCDTPPEAKLKPHVGSAREPSLEAVIALHPDLVFASASINWLQTVVGLTRAGIAVYTTDPHTVKQMLASIRDVANAAGAAPQGASLIARLQTRLDALHARLAETPAVPVLFVVWEDPLMTIGQNTFIADALRRAGAKSVIASTQNWPEVSIEEILRLQPDYIIFSTGHSDSGAAQLAELRSRAGWRALQAVQLGHVVVIGQEIERPSPGLVHAVEEVAADIHPAAFSSNSGEQRRASECTSCAR